MEQSELNKLQLKPIKGWPNYKVSDKGDVISFNYKKGPHKLKHIVPKATGFHVVNLSTKVDRNGNRTVKTSCVHRLVADAWLPKPSSDDNYVCTHIDGDKSNNDISNLKWITRHEQRGGYEKRKPVWVDDSKTQRVTYYPTTTKAAHAIGTNQTHIRDHARNGKLFRKRYKIIYAPKDLKIRT